MNDTSKDKRSLKYEAELFPLWDTIEASYTQTSSSDVVFRNILSLPPTLLDSTPQSKRKNEEDVEEEPLLLSAEEVAEMTDGEKKSYIGERAISVFNSYKKCVANSRFWINRIAENYSLEEAEIFLSNKLGVYIVELHLGPEVGLIEKKANKKGHRNMLLNEEIDISTYIVKTYPVLTIENLLNDDTEE
ncbi:MAG: hypothetical protein K2J48_11325 [Muribaculaceae bacterium]|nr:hypothetical protein [Muribaculaceae bacterium]